MTLLLLSRVFKSYVDGKVKALDDVSLSLGDGETVAVMGPSGCGKSTLLNVATGLEQPSSGSVSFDGSVVCDRKTWRRLRAEAIGIVFQGFHLLPALTALENVAIPMVGRIASGRRRRSRAMELLDRVGMVDRSDHLPGMLSGGEQQRVAIARALANGPRLLAADEPTGSLDPATGEEIVALLTALCRDTGMALLVVTHDTQLAERLQRTIRLHAGRLADSTDHVVPRVPGRAVRAWSAWSCAL